MSELEDAKKKAATTYNSGSDFYDHHRAHVAARSWSQRYLRNSGAWRWRWRL